VDPHSAKCDEAAIVRPDFGGTVVESGQGDVEIEDARTSHIEFRRHLKESRPEPLPGHPQHSRSVNEQRVEETRTAGKGDGPPEAERWFTAIQNSATDESATPQSRGSSDAFSMARLAAACSRTSGSNP
jgi:hypothetical protein